MSLLTLAQASAAATSAGFSGSALDIILAIAQAESGLDTAATNTAGNSAGTDRGILQINSYYHPEVSDACAFDATCAFGAGYTISHSGTDFTPWSTYNSGAYLTYMTAPLPSVHWQQPGLLALPETDGHGDTCGPIVIMDYLALLGRMTLSIASLDTYRGHLIGAGLMDVSGETGMTLAQIRDALVTYGVAAVKFVDYTSTLDFAAFHADLKNAMLAHQLVIFETSNASALPDGQTGVQYHFVLCGGIDSVQGYYTCNGDTYTALKSSVPVSPVWYGINSIQASAPCGYIILPAIPVPSGGSSMLVPANWNDNGSVLTAPNGIGVVGGFRDWVGSHTHDPNDWPLEAEFTRTPVELGAPSQGTGSVQYFKISGQMGYTTARGVYKIWDGQEEAALYADYLAAQGQVSALQQQLAAAQAAPKDNPTADAALAALQTLKQTLSSI